MIGVSIVAILFSIPRFFEVTTVYYCTQNETLCEPSVARTPLTEVCFLHLSFNLL